MAHHQAQGLEVASREPADGRERLGSSSEVDGFRVDAGHRLLVEGLPSGEPREFLDQLGISDPVGGADPDVRTARRPLARQIVGSAGARMDLNGQDLLAAPRQDLNLGNQPGSDAVADEVCQALLQAQRVADAAHAPALVLHTEEQRPARGVGERHDRSHHAVRRGEVPLELERLAFRELQDLGQVHTRNVPRKLRAWASFRVRPRDAASVGTPGMPLSGVA